LKPKKLRTVTTPPLLLPLRNKTGTYKDPTRHASAAYLQREPCGMPIIELKDQLRSHPGKEKRLTAHVA
jgi:hypothetical protein